MNDSQQIITLDGPAGSGKSSVARTLADRLGFAFLDTGAMYRAVAWSCLQAKIDLTNEAEATQIAEQLSIQFECNHLYCNGEEVTQAIRTPEVSQAASVVSTHPGVRALMVQLQQAAGRGKRMVTEGRDQGTVVFPDALYKFFVTASTEERARRRWEQEGRKSPLSVVLQDLKERDERDQNREVAPLKPADDAEIIDTTGLSEEEVISVLLEKVRSRLNHG